MRLAMSVPRPTVSSRHSALFLLLVGVALCALCLSTLLLRGGTNVSYKEKLSATKSDSAAARANRVAWAIPVGGATQRIDRLQILIRDLIAYGAGRHNVFIFEDAGSRNDPAQSEQLNAMAATWGVHILHSAISRSPPEPPDLFGLYLARHYQFMLDTLLLRSDHRYSPPSVSPAAFGYDYFVVLEDDLTLAPDAVHYFHAMSAVMDVDETLLCVCAHADNAFYAVTRSELELIASHRHQQSIERGAEDADAEHVQQFRDRHSAKSVDSTPLWIGLEEIEGLTLNDDEDETATATQLVERTSTSSSSLLTLSANEFDFRRGTHFMAPGWMTSAAIYSVIRPTWFNDRGELPNRHAHQMPNGNWDAFLDSRAFQLGLECIYPEIPRIAHRGANGYTVSARMQAELFDNLRLSTLPPTVDYGDLNRLTLTEYDQTLIRFIRRCTPLTALTHIALFRRSSLCIHIQTLSDRDNMFHLTFSTFFGLVSIGGHANFGKQRGIHKGAVFVRWMSNLVLIIGSHGALSKVYRQIHHAQSDLALSSATQADHGAWTSALTSFALGCFRDSRVNRILPFQLAALSPVTPPQCIAACALFGYAVAGVQWGWECWCAEAITPTITSARIEESACDDVCALSWDEKMAASAAKGKSGSNSGVGCGGQNALSVYRTSMRPVPTEAEVAAAADAALAAIAGAEHVHTHSVDAHTDMSQLTAAPKKVHRVESATADVELIRSLRGQSCSDACAAQSLTCDDALLPAIHRDCPALQKLMSCPACHECESPWDCFAAPGQRRPIINNTATATLTEAIVDDTSAPCLISRGKYLRCSATAPAPDFVRACACTQQIHI